MEDIQSVQQEAKQRKTAIRSMIDSAFPSMGTEKRAHEGSQSVSPPKEGNGQTPPLPKGASNGEVN